MGTFGTLLTHIDNLTSLIIDYLYFLFESVIFWITWNTSSDSLGLALLLIATYSIVRLISRNRSLGNLVYFVGYGVISSLWLIGAVANYHGVCRGLGVIIGLGGGDVAAQCQFNQYLAANGLLLIMLLGVPIVVHFVRRFWRWSLARRRQ